MSAFPPILEVVPHEPPMLLIDEVLAASEDEATSRVRISASSPFLEDGRVPAVLMIEHMAQTIAAWVGVQGRAKGEKPKIGFLVACREASFEVDWVDVGDELVVHVVRSWGESELGNFDCTVTRRGQCIARGNLSVYRGDLAGMEFA